MNIYEVVFWNSHGNRDSKDTIYLVRAPDFQAALEFVTRNGGTGSSIPDVVYEVGVDLSPYAPVNPCILRGPYFDRAVNRGWKKWQRHANGPASGKQWEEEEINAKGRLE